MDLLFASAEVAPYSKTGGLGDVAGALPPALQNQLASVTVISPLYADINKDAFQIRSTPISGQVTLGTDIYTYTLHSAPISSALPRFVFIENEHYFGRRGIYTTSDGEGFSDNNQRFFFFQLVILDLLERNLLQADIVHCNDHHTALLPLLLKHAGLNIRTLFTIHNFLYHGHFSPEDAQLLPKGLVDLLKQTQWANYSALLEGIDHADRVNTVSPGYASELLRGVDIDVHSFAHILAAGDKFSGIVNGIDTKIWDPGQDPYLTSHYNRNDLQGKQANKQQLLIQCGFDADPSAPLFGSISRLVENKGFPLILEVIEEFVNQAVRFIFLGNGSPGIAQQLSDLSRRYPRQVYFHEGYSEALAHLIEAGSDIFLMPSRFEPCGLNQLYSLRYGTVPLVNRTGGLADTVTEVPEHQSTGFIMDAYKVSELRLAMLRALDAFRDTRTWLERIQRGMAQDWSWDRSALEYLKIYQALEGR